MTLKKQQRLNTVVWFEIPAADLARATAFYEEILQMKMQPYLGGGARMNIFPYTEPAIGGAVIEGASAERGSGSVVYLNGDPSLDAVLARIEPAGGSILLGRTEGRSRVFPVTPPPRVGYLVQLCLDHRGIGCSVVNKQSAVASGRSVQIMRVLLFLIS